MSDINSTKPTPKSGPLASTLSDMEKFDMGKLNASEKGKK